MTKIRRINLTNIVRLEDVKIGTVFYIKDDDCYFILTDYDRAEERGCVSLLNGHFCWIPNYTQVETLISELTVYPDGGKI